MRRLREDIDLLASIATIAIVLVAVGSWLAQRPAHILSTAVGIAGLVSLLTVGGPRAVSWLRARYRETVSDDKRPVS
jgi:hypothetical protein